MCLPILSEEPLSFLLNSYTTGLSPAVMEYLLGLLLQKNSVEQFPPMKSASRHKYRPHIAVRKHGNMDSFI